MTEVTAEKKDVVPAAYREKYKATGGTCGDFIATQLSNVAKDGTTALNSIKTENSIDANRWAEFNAGMQRMNLANTLRARYLKGETVTILGKQFNAKHQVEDFNGKVQDDPKVLLKVAKFLDLQESDRTVASLQKLFFPPAPKGPTKEEREAKKAEALAAKDAAKADKAKAADEKKAAAATAKAEKATAAAAAKAEREKVATAAKEAKATAAAAAKAEKAKTAEAK